MTLQELTYDQVIELKQTLLFKKYEDDPDKMSPSYGELAAVDDVISDEELEEAYGGVDFTPDDFFCSCK